MLTKYSPIEHLGTALWLSHWQSGFMLMLTGYFDETGESTDPTQPVNGIAGFIGKSTAWISLENEWNKHPKLRNFHDRDIRGIRRKEQARKIALNVLEKYPIVPVGWMANMDVWRQGKSKSAALDAPHWDMLWEPYYRAYDYCLRMASALHLSKLSMYKDITPEVATVFDEKIVFFDRAMAYYRVWSEANPEHKRVAGPPLFRSSESFAPLKAADCLAGILRDHLKSRITDPPDTPKLDSYLRVLKLAERQIAGGIGKNIPLAFIETEADVEGYLK